MAQFQHQDIIEITHGASLLRFAPQAGGRLLSWHIDGQPVIYWPEVADWSHPAKIRGGNPLLFPFLGRHRVALQPPPTFDPGTPEATAQGYFQAISDGDEELAESYMTDELVDACSGQWYFYDIRESPSVVITDSEIDGDTAKLGITIDVSYGGGPFDGASYDQDETLTMEHRVDVWLISKPTWPMDRYACGSDF